mmetsp:Transcript_23048/g.38993  ORF Transcript_23048/g.38993 Transcript_23048/m.38993 type:complete len:155 (-) Transcript_23048:432-896(-)
MNQAAIDRKRKLQEIRERSSKKANNSTSNDANAEESQEKAVSIKFRNYQPRDSALVKAFVNNDQNNKGEENTVDNGVQEKAEQAIGDSDIIKNELRQYEEEEELNILPKNNNWDLKKQLEPKIEKLQRRTQRAIVDILREKIAEEEDSEEEADA